MSSVKSCGSALIFAKSNGALLFTWGINVIPCRGRNALTLATAVSAHPQKSCNDNRRHSRISNVLCSDRASEFILNVLCSLDRRFISPTHVRYVMYCIKSIATRSVNSGFLKIILCCRRRVDSTLSCATCSCMMVERGTVADHAHHLTQRMIACTPSGCTGGTSTATYKNLATRKA